MGASDLSSSWHLPWEGGVCVSGSERSRFVLNVFLGGCCSTELLGVNRAVCSAFTASLLHAGSVPV